MAARESSFLRVNDINLNDDVRILQSDSSRKILYQDLYDDIATRIGAATADTELPYRTITASTGLLTDDRVIYIDTDTAGGDVTLALPLASAVVTTPGKSPVYTIKKIGGDAFDAIIQTSGDTVDGQATVTLIGPLFPFINLISDGTNWWSY